MLAKILEDMWVDPEVLKALSEEQKRILFLKMREEQVRRWREREQREETEGWDNSKTGPVKASRKHVSWLLGRDGDVSVSVIGDVDEFRSSKLLQSLMNNRYNSDNMNGIKAVDLQPGSEAYKEEIQLPLTDNQSSEEDVDSCGNDDDLKDPTEDSDSESGSGSDSLGAWTPPYRSHLSRHGNGLPLKALLSDTERDDPQDREIVCCDKKQSQYEGRVAQLRKTFNSDPHSTTAAYTKPPVPAKPARLQTRSTPFIH